MIAILLVYLGLALVAAAARVVGEVRTIDRVALVGFLLLAFATRPDIGRHRTAIANTIVDAPLANNQMRSAAARAALASEISRRIETTDYRLFTVATRHRSVVSVGLFGRVFVRPSLTE